MKITNMDKVSNAAKRISEMSEELWDEYSEYVGDTILDLEQIAGTVILKRTEYYKLVSKLCKFTISEFTKL